MCTPTFKITAFGLIFTVFTSPLSAESVDLDEAALRNIVERSYQYVAMYNVNNKGALQPGNPLGGEGWNQVFANTELADHTVTAIARPNNDTLYSGAYIDVTKEPMVMEIPAFDSTYVSLMVTGYDHYVNVPMTTRSGDFKRPETMLFYSARTPGYSGEAVEGVDRTMEVTGDFVSAVFRVMPHANDPQRRERNFAAMQSITLTPLSAFKAGNIGVADKEVDLAEETARFPTLGESDFDTFETNFLEVMQFVFNHTTFSESDSIDQELIATFEPFGIEPGKTWNPETAASIDGAALRAVAEVVAEEKLAAALDPEFSSTNLTEVFKPKGEMELSNLVLQSVLGPIGLPAAEAVYPYIGAAEGTLNALNDYEIVMAPDEMPPATAFWSLTLYESERGFFIPNDRFKYSVGENTGYKLDEDGGIRVVIAAEQPEGVPEENWLPIARGDYDMDVTLRIYAPDLEAFAEWSPPVAQKLD